MHPAAVFALYHPAVRTALTAVIHHPAVRAAVTAAVHHHAIKAVAVAAVVHPHLIRAAVEFHIRVIRLLAGAFGLRKPKVTVVTPTWKRHRLLVERCIPSVLAQTYRGEIDHIIVSDGPDEMLADVPGVRFLPVHVPAVNRGIHARRYGADRADSDLVAYLDDDNAWRPDHLELLVDAITSNDVSFAHSRALCRNEYGVYWMIGCFAPVFGQIDTSLIVHTRGLLETANWQPSGPKPADWDLVERWLEAGATHVYVPAVTMDYYAHAPAPCPA